MLMSGILGENLIDDFFDDFARTDRRPVRYGVPAASVMKTDIRENETGFELEIDLPGYKKENVEAQLKDGYLTVTAKSASENEEKKEEGRYIRRERYAGTCSRSYYVGKYVEIEDIKARFEDGILKITVPKKEAKPKEEKFVVIEG